MLRFIRSLPEGSAPSQGRRVVVVDDNTDVAQSLARFLRLLGHQVVVAFDGVEALDAAARLTPEFVFLDIGLPNVNGYDVARRLREQPGGDKIVLVAVSGWGKEEDKRRAREAGFDHHFTKPVDPAVLAGLIDGKEELPPAGPVPPQTC